MHPEADAVSGYVDTDGAVGLAHVVEANWCRPTPRHPDGGLGSIEVRDVPEAADEYDSYLGPIGARLRECEGADEIARYLTEVEEERMGLGVSEAARTRNAALAKRLIDWHAQGTEA